MSTRAETVQPESVVETPPIILKGLPFSLLIYGPSKVGKSTVMLTAPGKILFLDVEGQTRFLPNQNRRKDWDMYNENPPTDDGTWDWCRVRCRSYDDIKRAYEWLNSGAHPFHSVVIDSISELQQKYVDKLAGEKQMEQQQWGELLRGLAALVRSIRDLLEHPTHPLMFVGITAMEQVSATGKKSPLLQGKIAQMAPYFLDIVGYFTPMVVDMTSGATVRRLYVSPSPFYDAGSRIPNISGYLDDPSINGIFTTNTQGE